MAFTGRDIGFLFNAEANWPDPADDVANVSWVTESHAAIRDFADGRACFNFGGFADEAGSAIENTLARSTTGSASSGGSTIPTMCSD